jgi:hypothetical protein
LYGGVDALAYDMETLWDKLTYENPNQVAGSPDLIGGIGGALKGIKLSKAVLSSWKNVNFKSVSSTIKYHVGKHGNGKTIEQFTDDALNFYKKFSSQGKSVILKDGTEGLKIKDQASGWFGIYDKSGKIVTFGYK